MTSSFVKPTRSTPAPGRRDRVRARAWALQVLYRWEMESTDGDPRDALAQVLRTRRVAPGRREHLQRLIDAVADHREEIDDRLRAALANWRLERLGTVDRCILRLSAAELLYLEDVPDRVALQEGIRLAERYGGAESAAFVNGVLDALYRSTRS